MLLNIQQRVIALQCCKDYHLDKFAEYFFSPIVTFECYLEREKRSGMKSSGNDFFHSGVHGNISGFIVTCFAML